MVPVAKPPAGISIHAPHAGSDENPTETPTEPQNFNPRSPCGERPEAQQTLYANMIFQSTLPMRGATDKSFFIISQINNFNPRSPCGERPKFSEVENEPYDFNPRSPCGERHPRHDRREAVGVISIHAPHAGSDRVVQIVDGRREIISIHAPHAGSDRGSLHSSRAVAVFQSTLPMRGATAKIHNYAYAFSAKC